MPLDTAAWPLESEHTALSIPHHLSHCLMSSMGVGGVVTAWDGFHIPPLENLSGIIAQNTEYVHSATRGLYKT